MAITVAPPSKPQGVSVASSITPTATMTTSKRQNVAEAMPWRAPAHHLMHSRLRSTTLIWCASWNGMERSMASPKGKPRLTPTANMNRARPVSSRRNETEGSPS